MASPSPERSYLAELRQRLQGLLGDDLVGVYVGGSYPLGGYRRARSDLDLAAVVDAPLPRDRKALVVERLRHESLPCPARGLELVIYRLETAGSPSAAADFELNLNAGREMDLRIDHRPGSGSAHWFPIDRSVLAQGGIALQGPAASEVFAPIPLVALVPVLVESIRWHRANARGSSDAVLNACRSLRYAVEERWSSKPEAGRWAVDRGTAPPELVAEAIAARSDDSGLDPVAVDEFLGTVECRLRATGRQARTAPSAGRTRSA